MMTPEQQLQLKLDLEKKFRPEVKRIFNAISKAFKITVAATGTPIDASRFLPSWMVALEKHYSRVQKAFTGLVIPKEKQEEDEESKNELLLLALLAWQEMNVRTHSNLLVETTRKNMRESINQAREALMADGHHYPTDRELSLAATAILKRKFKGRTPTVVMSETQAAAEATKFIEAEVETGITPRILGGGTVVTTTKKIWTTIGDSKVRPIHSNVNGQVRSLHEAFIVSGEFLMHPGDGSMGASAGNIINCRCVSQYSLAAA